MCSSVQEPLALATFRLLAGAHFAVISTSRGRGGTSRTRMYETRGVEVDETQKESETVRVRVAAFAVIADLFDDIGVKKRSEH